MKKIIICLLAFSFLTFMSCKKEENNQEQQQQEQINPAKDFEGEYSLSGTINLNLPDFLGGTQEMPINGRHLTISLKGDKGDVIIVTGDYVFDGYVNDKGLHVDPIIVNYPVSSLNVQMTIAIPTVTKPVNGVTTCTANITANISSYSITGTADFTAEKIN